VGGDFIKEGVLGGSWGNFDRGSSTDGRDIQWMHGLGPCTTLFFGSLPLNFLMKLHHSSIFL
jgi:hypothetical protein